jgi:TetR/AcrR family transcriptional regulator
VNARHEILKAALRQMAARGADSTSLQAIADEVGIKKPSILYHFDSKEGLRKAVVTEILVRWNEVLPRLFLTTVNDATGRFQSLAHELVSFFSEDPNRAKLIFRELLDRPKEMRAYLQEYVRPWIKMIASEVEKGRAAGRINAGIDPEAFVWVLINSVIANIAAASSISGADNVGDSENNVGRLMEEVLRTARASLFSFTNTEDKPHKPSQGAQA